MIRTNHDDRQRKLLLAALTLLLAAAGGLVLFSPTSGRREKPLLARATRLFAPDVLDDKTDIAWTSPTKAILRLFERQTFGPDGPRPARVRAYRINAGASPPTAAPITPPPTDRLGEPIFNRDFAPLEGDLSPNGRWLLHLQYAESPAAIGVQAAELSRAAGTKPARSGGGFGGDAGASVEWPDLPPKAAVGLRDAQRAWEWLAVSLNDGREVRLPADDYRPADASFFGYGRAIWLPDSSGWMRVRALPGRRVELQVQRLNGTQTVLPVAGRLPAGEHYEEAAGVTRDGRVVLLSTKQVIVALTEIGPATGTARLRALPPWTPPRPQARIEYDPVLSEVRVSPDGYWVAYCLTYSPVEPLVRRELRASFSGMLPEPDVTELWVGRIDGSAQRCLGSVRVEPSVPQGITQVRWTPDGKRLSFLSGGGLYLLPADADD